ncbi:uncharacterized protein LOC135139643 [Zophobas morio]|uniref:uncharacterized protein LOC135139643 n=1 Tax=Zophobas morio TaxID=2755281 RepID=UPI003082B910
MKLFAVFVLVTVTAEDTFTTSERKNQLDATDNMFQINARLKYYIPYNKAQSKAGLLDYHHNISVFYDGLTGDAFAFYYEQGHGVFIPGGTSDQTWDIKRQKYEEYFENPVAPPRLFKTGEKHGYQLYPDEISETIALKLSQILTPLSPDYSSQCQALATILFISKTTSDRLKTSLSGLETVVGDINGRNRGDFRWLIGMAEGIADYFSMFGGIDALNQKHVHLDLAKVLNQQSGIHVLCYFVETLAPHFDLGTKLGKHLNSQPDFFVLICKLGGGISYGFDGFVCVILEIVKYNYGENSIENVAANLKTYVGDARAVTSNLGQKWHTFIQELQETIKGLELDRAFGGLMELLQDIVGGNWVQKGINMSEIVEEVINVEIPGSECSVIKIVNDLKKKIC